MFELLLLASKFAAPTPVIVAIAVLVVGLLIVRFVIKTAITLVKIGILVAIGVATWIGLSYIVDAIG